MLESLCPVSAGESIDIVSISVKTGKFGVFMKKGGEKDEWNKTCD